MTYALISLHWGKPGKPNGGVYSLRNNTIYNFQARKPAGSFVASWLENLLFHAGTNASSTNDP
jgi:hypothetical protein